MPEPIDVIMRALQRIQADFSAIRGRLDDVGEHVAANTSKLEATEGSMTCQVGLTSRQGPDIGHIQADIKALKTKIAGLESRP